MYPVSMLEDQKAEFRKAMQQSIEGILAEAGLLHVTAKVFDDGGLKIEVAGSRADLLLVRPLLYKYAGIVSYRTLG